jgi:hypothetical protein
MIASAAAFKESVFTNDLAGQDLTVLVVTHAAYTMQPQPYVVAIVAAAVVVDAAVAVDVDVDVVDVVGDVVAVVVVVFDVVQHSSNSSPNCSFIALTFSSQDTAAACACRLDDGFFDDRTPCAAAFASCGAATSSRDDAAARGLA